MLEVKRLRTVLAIIAVAFAALALPQTAMAREGHSHHHGSHLIIGGGIYPGWLWGPGWGYYGPYPYPYGYGYGYPYRGPYSNGPDMNAAAVRNLGAVEMHVKPGSAHVFVDGKFIAEARDLDGSPSYLWLKAGGHQVVVYKDGYKTFDEKIAVRRGVLRQLKVHMEKGEAGPPPVPPARDDDND